MGLSRYSFLTLTQVQRQKMQEQCAAAFELFSKDNAEQLLGIAELDLVLRSLGQEPSPKELADIMEGYGSRPGKINHDDFMDLMASQIRANASDRNADNLSAQIVQFLMDTFRMFDQDKDGYISKEELAKACDMIGAGDMAEALMAEGDQNKDSKIDFDEWIDMMKDIACYLLCKINSSQIF